MAKFQIYQDKKKQFRWRLLADNNQIIATGEGYTSKAGCKNGIESVKKNAPKADIEDQT
ncbi:MAG: YegP family protein [Anaerolineales bacterium]|nr:YegP family protein [Anaerolineales bacterium]